MKPSIRAFLFGAFGAAALTLSCFATSSALPFREIQLNSEKVQVVHGTTPNSDTTTMTLDMTNIGDGGCDTDDDLIAGGLSQIALSSCSCAELICASSGFCVNAGSFEFLCTVPYNDHIPRGGFVSHTINHHQYGTFFRTTLSAKATKLTTPPDTCGRWTLNLTATKLNLSLITQSSVANPIALLLDDGSFGDDAGPFCYDIPDAVVGPVIVH
jgi:hypothetical protein